MTTKIRYVCVSDLHLGAVTSVLTNLDADGEHTDGPAPLLLAVLDALRRLVEESGATEPPTLVVHGDVFELALTTTERAAETFGHLVRAAWGDPHDPLFGYEVLYVPGNHDHHVWEITREYRHQYDLRNEPGPVAAMPHVTPLVPGRIPATDHEPFAGVLARRALDADGIAEWPHFQVLYPNVGLVDESGDRAVVVTHGHYLERIYRTMTFLHNVVMPDRPPRLNADQLEADNWAWIDFFWSTMGRSGEGNTIPVLYELLQSETSMNAIVDRVLDDVHPRTRSLRRGAQRWALRKAGRHLSGVVAARERLHAGVLSPEATIGLTRYLEGPVLSQLRDELPHVPHRLDIVFGHTHKPFAARRQPEGYPGPVVAHNTGGWVIDAVEPEPMKGASIALVSEDHEVVDLCVYRQDEDSDRYRMRVLEVNDGPREATPLRDWLIARIDPGSEPWAGISRLAAQTVGERQRQLARRIQQGTVAVRTEPPVGPRGW